MKKIYMIIIFLIITIVSSVSASSIILEPVIVNNKYELKLKINDRDITYDEAMKMYDFDEYMKLYVKGKDHYFYRGSEIDKYDYLRGNSIENANKKASSYGTFGVRVHNTYEIISAIDRIYSSLDFGTYHLVFSTYESEEIDITQIENEYQSKYVSELNKNMYIYNEYYKYSPIKFGPEIKEDEIIISHNSLKTTDVEQKKVELFVDEFIDSLENKTDYEKILIIYTYLKNTVSINTTDVFENSYSAYLSAYDTIFDKVSGCIGISTTVQLMLERLNIKSYIVDHPYLINENDKKYMTMHTYNVLRLDDKWYILDLTNNDGFLIGLNHDYDINDFKYYDLTIENETYVTKNNFYLDIDYEKYNRVIENILNEKEIVTTNKVTKENQKDVIKIKFSTFVIGLIIVIMTIITCLIYIFTR